MEDNLEFKSMSGQLAVDEAQGVVECFVAAVGNKDSVGDVVVSGAFNASFKRRKPRVVWGHDWNQPIGKVLDIYEVPSSDPRLPAKMKQANVGGLYAKVQFNLKSERGREAFNSITFFGEDQEWSIGYKTLDSIYSPERQANLLKEVELYEVSPVLHGANQLTATISIKSLDVSSMDKEAITSFRKSEWETFDFAWAKKLHEEHPEIWKAGGNIKGNDQWQILSKILENGGTAETEDQVNALELREAWIARHEGDFRLPGVVAQIKWLAVGKQGESAMKKVVNDEIKRRKERMQGKAEKTCPVATRDIGVNIKNRQNAIDTAGYGPLNPKEPNVPFWTKKADRWDVTADEAKKQKCGNCAAFIRTPSMLKCIEGALGNEAGNEAMDVINAGQLGYCEAFDFKCASARTCDAWIVGGPITEEKDQAKVEEAESSKTAVIDTSEFALSLARDLAAEVAMSVRVTEIDKGYVVFDAKDPESGSLETMRAEFEFDGAEFAFSDVRPYRDEDSDEEDSMEADDTEDSYSGEDIALLEDDVEEPSDEDDTEEEWTGSSPQLKKPCGCGCNGAPGGCGEDMIKVVAMGGQAANTVDHDGDGIIFDGTPNEQRAIRRQDAPAVGKGVSKRAKFADGSTTVMNADGSGEITTPNGNKYSYGASDEEGALKGIPKQYLKGMEQLHTAHRNDQRAMEIATDAYGKNPNRDANKPKISTFGDGAKTRVEEDGSGSITTPDGRKFEYGDFEDPTALDDVPPKYQAGLKKARREQDLKNRQAAEVAKQRGYRMNPSTRPKDPAPKKYPKASQLNPDGTPKEPNKLTLNPDGSIYEPPKKKTDQMDEQEIKAPNASQLQSLSNATSRVPTGSNLVPDTLPQERVTGDVLRGYGPRRGNLERLLRYWRPIMRKEGGFRRCRVILADHPELYPLNNICAWLHHETTGLWPNEGCHHPGMKNCRRKLKNIVRGSVISDSDFNTRMNKLRGGKSADLEDLEIKCGGSCGGMCGHSRAEDMSDHDGFTVAGPGAGMASMHEDDDYTEEDVLHAIRVFRSFMEDESDFVDFLRNESNWHHEGHNGDGEWKSYEPEAGWSMKEAGCGCEHDEEDVMDIELLDDIDMKALPFDIDMEGENPLATELKQLLANTYTFSFRTSGYHWNVTGPDFSQYHELFGEIYEDVSGAIDPIAEDIRKLGSYSPYKIEEFMRLRSISDTVVESDPQSLAKDLLAANELMLVSLGEAFDLATRMDEQGVANFLAERIDMHDKWRWQLKASVSNSGQIKADPFMMEGNLEEAQDSNLVEMLKTVLADTVSFYFKAHGYHWNVETQDFSQYHALFSEIYDDTLSAVNPAAENIRKLGAFSPFRLSDFVGMRTIKDTNVSSEPQLMASDLASANDILLRNLMEAFDVANDANEQGIANFLAERIDSHQKWRWQLRSSTEAAQLLKNATLDEIMTKAGRVLNGRNLDKLRQAVELIQGVVSAAGVETIEMKTVGTIAVSDEDLEGLIEAIEPVFDYYEIDANITDTGVEIKDFANVSEDAKSALQTAIGNFVAMGVQEKGFFTRGPLTDVDVKGIGIGGHGPHIPRDGDGDGFFSPGPKLPDKTPISKLPEAMAKLKDEDLFASLRFKPKQGIGKPTPKTEQDDKIAAFVELRRRGHSEESLAKLVDPEVLKASLKKWKEEWEANPPAERPMRMSAGPKPKSSLPDPKDFEKRLEDLDIGDKDKISEFAQDLLDAINQHPSDSKEGKELDSLFADLEDNLKDAFQGEGEALYSADEIGNLLHGEDGGESPFFAQRYAQESAAAKKMDKFRADIAEMTAPHLNNKLKKAEREYDAMPDGPEKAQKKLEIQALKAEKASRVGGKDKPSKPMPEAKPKTVKRGDPNPRGTGKEFPTEGHELLYGGKLGPYPVSGTDAEKKKWEDDFAKKVRYMKKDELNLLKGDLLTADNQAARGVIKQTPEEEQTIRVTHRLVNSEKRRRLEFARGRSGGSRDGGSSGSRSGWTKYRRTDNGQPIWFDDSTDDAYDAMKDGFIERR